MTSRSDLDSSPELPSLEAWPSSLGAGFVAGVVGGLVFLAIGFARDSTDFLAYWPTAAIGWWLVVRSVAIYGLVFGVCGTLLASLMHLVLRRGRRLVFALVLAAMVALTVLTYLTAWWQIEVLAGLPMGDPERQRGAFGHVLVALGVGGLVAGLGIWRARRRDTVPSLARPALVTFACLLSGLILGNVGLGHSGPVGGSAAGLSTADGKPPSQVVVVGLDGMTLRVLSPLLRAGELPTFRRLMEEGAWGTLLTYGTASSPQVWTTVATGKRVRDHGIDDFVKTHDSGRPEGGQTGSYRAALMKSSDRKARAIWNILSDAGRRVAVVDWLVTFPPEEVNGYLISRLKLDAQGRTHPPELDAELTGLWGEGAAGSPHEGDRGRGTRQHLLWNIDRVFATAGHLLAKEPLDFLAVYDATVDRVEHQSWKYYQAAAFDAELWQVEPERVAALASLIPDVYRHLDRKLGELMDRLADDALVLVVSDHGQRAAETPRVRLRLDRVLEALGYSRLLPVGGPRDRVDYAASRAYTLVETPWTPVLRVNLNLLGREPQGIVDPSEARAIVARVVEDLRGVRFEDGTPLFTAVTPARDPKSGGGRGADIRVALSRHARSLERSAQRLVVGEVAGDAPLPLRHYQHVNPEISGAHDHQGVIFARGPGIKPGFIGQRVVPTALHDLLWHLTDKIDAVDRLLPILRRLGLIERASTLDLTPTMLYALGLPAARDMAGRPLKALFRNPPGVEWLASYETAGQQRRADEESPPIRPPSGEPSDEEYLERLRALGYVD